MHLKALGDSLAAAYVLLVMGELKAKWKALQYLYHRQICEAMEEKYFGIAGDAGYEYALGVLANLPKDNQEKQTPA